MQSDGLLSASSAYLCKSDNLPPLNEQGVVEIIHRGANMPGDEIELLPDFRDPSTSRNLHRQMFFAGMNRS